jgi:hypothetical protein
MRKRLSAIAAGLFGAFNPRGKWGESRPSNEPAPQQGLTVEEMEKREKARRHEKALILHERELEKTAKSMQKLAQQGLSPEDILEGRYGERKRKKKPRVQTITERPPLKKKKKKKKPKWKKRKWGSCRTSQNVSKKR